MEIKSINPGSKYNDGISAKHESFSGYQTLFGNRLRETPFRGNSVALAGAKQSFADGVPKQSLGTRNEVPYLHSLLDRGGGMRQGSACTCRNNNPYGRRGSPRANVPVLDHSTTRFHRGV